MSDPSIYRLVVSGREPNVRVFQTAVKDSERSSLMSAWNSERKAIEVRPVSGTSLSFARLLSQLLEDDQRELDQPVEEPWNDTGDSFSLVVQAPEEEVRHTPGMVNLVYRFMLRSYDPEELLTRSSKLFPNLCFVLGWVNPAWDEQKSAFIHDGYSDMYELPDDLKQSLRDAGYLRYGIQSETAAESDDPNLFWAEVEGDWAMLDTAIQYWDSAVDRALSAVSRRMHPCHRN